jgi:alpha-1,3-glucan synthase
MPGWWYSIESTTTKHLITQFEAACHEALLSDRATRELMRAKSAMQRFPVIEWIKQLDKLQVSAIRISKRSKKQSGIPTRQSAAGNEFRTSSKNPDAPQKSPQGIIDEPKATSTPNMSSRSVVSRRNSHQSLGDSQRESYPDSIASDTERDTEDELTNEGVQTPTNTHVRNISDLSLKDKDEDACHVQQGAGSSPNEPGSKKSNITRRVSLGRRLGPGHTPIASDSLGALGEEQLYTIPVADDEHNEHILSAPVIGQEMTKNANNARRGGNLPQRNDADQDSDSENLPDSQDFDEPQSSVLNRQHRERESKDIEGSNLSLASVLGGRDDFALCKVEALFNDADGKYFKEYSSELQKSHPRTSKYALCIEEFITRSEKQWSSVVRNNKLGIDAHLGSDILSHFTKKVPTSPSSHASDELPTHSDELPFLGYRPPQGMKLFLQRRFGDWPLYTFFLALVCPPEVSLM